MTYKKKLIEVALPLDAINKASAREKSIRHGHPSTLHLWWARRPLAAARAVLWSSLVDDPSAYPEKFPTETAQEAERQRLFRILEELVIWENSNNEQVLAAATAEIEASCDGNLPNILDPFCGGGTIPLEAQRLGLPAYGGDLNPVAVLISKAMIEIPPRFSGLQPVNADARAESGLKTWERAQGLAEDVRHYGQWMRDRAFERIGNLYPKVTLPPEQGGAEATAIAWIWARTVISPDPAWEGHVPLVRSWILRKGTNSKPVVWVEPIIDRESRTIKYEIREGGTPIEGTVRRQGGTCIATGSPINLEHVREEGRQGRVGAEPIAVVVEGVRGRVYAPPQARPEVTKLSWSPPGQIFDWPGRTNVVRYGMTEWGDLFTDRQLVALVTFSDVLSDVRREIEKDARAAGLVVDNDRLSEGGDGAIAYADAVTTYLAFAIDKCADYWSTIATWATGGFVRGTFARQAIPMTWDFAETNPFSSSTGNWMAMVKWTSEAITHVPAAGTGEILQRDAASRLTEVATSVVSTDPPYYDNVSYADLSDYFYVWLRHNLREIWPDELSTLLTPKGEELIANRYRAGSAEAAREHFESGMEEVFEVAAAAQHPDFPATVFYAFKQSETDAAGVASTGWETFVQGLLAAGFAVTATWPVRTERAARPVASGAAALASSIVLALRPRAADAPLATRSEFLSMLRSELPDAIRLMQRESIAPVDMAQSAIGPGMAVFSRYAKVIEADGSQMTVRQALALINEVLEEVLSEEETEFDSDTRWALTWFDQYGLNAGPFGDAETLSKAKGTSVAGVIHAGVADQSDGKVRLLDRGSLTRSGIPRMIPG